MTERTDAAAASWNSATEYLGYAGEGDEAVEDALCFGANEGAGRARWLWDM